jgi:hypothetical protein
MAIDIERLQALCKGENLKYFLAPDRPMVMLGFGGLNGRYQVVIPIEVDGRFLQVRTVGYLHCPADHPAVDEVLQILGHLNFQFRMTKFGWDPSDGEIVAYTDVWVEDGDLTQKQFSALLRSLLPAIDLNYKRLTETMETGKDPGVVTPESLAGDNLPSKLRKLLEKVKEGSDDDGDGDFDKV